MCGEEEEEESPMTSHVNKQINKSINQFPKREKAILAVWGTGILYILVIVSTMYINIII